MSPSDRHTELRNMAARWIENRSFKRCSVPECSSVGYIADLVVLAGMWDAYHSRYAYHNKLEKKYMTTDCEGKRTIHGDIDRWYICVFEIKVSRADFLNTFGSKKSIHSEARIKSTGTMHWIVADKGVCNPEELPEFWGLLEPYGTGLTERKIPRINILTDSEIHAIAFDMMWQEKNHRWSYYESRTRMADAIGDVRTAIVHDKPKDELLRLSKIAVKMCNGLSLIKKEDGTFDYEK